MTDGAVCDDCPLHGAAADVCAAECDDADARTRRAFRAATRVRHNHHEDE